MDSSSNNFFPLPKKIPTRSNYHKIKKHLTQASSSNFSIIYHRGGTTHTRDDTDVELDFRQESNFFYLSGVEAAGYHILILLSTDEIYLISPTVPSTEQLWKGTPPTSKELLEKYDADHILTEEQLLKLLRNIEPDVLYTLDTTDLSVIPEHLHQSVDSVQLRGAINEARLTKLPWEISILRYSAHISSHAHMALMYLCGKNKNKKQLYEAELEAKYRYVCARNGLARQCYIPIIASGPRAAVLHYTDNDRLIPNGPHSLVLVDAGGEHKCYGSDVTRTFPVCGKFSKEAKTIYNIVLKAQNVGIKRGGIA
jgi:Xaa-Pro dipeptidase